MKIAVVTDSGSGIEKSDIGNLFVIGMPFRIDGCEYFEGVNIDKRTFFDIMRNKEASFQTSQPSLYNVKELWDNILKEYDAIIHIALSSGLSASYKQTYALALDEYQGKVFVPDHHRVSVTQRGAIDSALSMIEDGYSPKEICDFIENTGLNSSIYIMVDTLKFLKKGGRVTPSAAALGELLRIEANHDILTSLLNIAKIQSTESSNKIEGIKTTDDRINALINDITTRFKTQYEEGRLGFGIAHSDDIEGAHEVEAMILKKLPKLKFNHIDYLSNLISCHTGPDAIGVGCYEIYKRNN